MKSSAIKNKWFPLAPPTAHLQSSKLSPNKIPATTNSSTITSSNDKKASKPQLKRDIDAFTPEQNNSLIVSPQAVDNTATSSIPGPPLVDTSKESTTPVFQLYHIEDSSFLLLIKLSSSNSNEVTLFLAGHGYATLLHGQAILFGYKMIKSERVVINNVPWSASFPIYCSRSNKPSKLNPSILKANLSDHVYTNQHMNIMTECTDFDVIILLHSVPQSSMELMLQLERMHDVYKIIQEPEYSPSKSISSPSTITNIGSLVIYSDINSAATFSIESLNLPFSWMDAIENIKPTPSIPSTPISPKVIFCGSKGSGKSTCLRYAVNSLLGKCSKIAVLDCDVGQPEFALPGTVALSIVDRPNFNASHLNNIKPIAAYFIGDVVTKNDPELVLSAIAQLLLKYEELRDDFENERKSKTKDLNGFAALGSKSVSLDITLPLLINADGWTRGMGAEMLGNILHTISPTHVIHLCNERNRELYPLLALPPSTRIFNIEPGRYTPSRIVAFDLRILRFIAAFLRNKIVDIGEACIKNASVVDYAGVLANALLNADVHHVPFSSIAFTLKNSPVCPRLILGAFNLSMVGVIPSGNDQSNDRVDLKLGDNLFTIQYSNTTPLLPCSGIAIVRAIDICNSSLILISSCNETSFPEYSLLERSNIPLPVALQFIPGQPCCPYLSGETEGEGNSTMKARTNLKRKWHNG